MKELDLTPLERYPIDKITLSIVLDTRREKQKGYYPIKYRITYLRQQIYYPCIDILAEDYSALHGIVKRTDLVEQKKLILAGFENIKKTIQGIVNETEGFSLEKLNTRLSKGVKNSILTAFDNKIDSLKKAGKIGTSVWYSCAKNSIEKYTGRDIKFSEVTAEWLKKYEAHLLMGGKEYTTISINMRALRAIINDGMRDGIISQAQYPFVVKNNGKYQIPEGTGRKIALNISQLMEVFNYPISPENEKWRDLWVFSFYCNGANISDILRFKYENIAGNYIEWYRKKTINRDKEKSKIRAAITEEMQMIINKYGNKNRHSHDYIFPYLINGLSPIQERMIIQNVTHTINKKMKAIGRALGIGDITTYWSRHTWASISRHEGVSLFGISKGMGHKNLTTTQIYLDSLSDDELMENAAKLPRRNNK